ncbi:helix-turn-helix domain-containing protein [Sphingopyxis terrae]|uniref:helix-turn-helix domain-containing protein n=1 Tax=Sphingopyxis terrae TaxID=33052 RepID=UPI00157D0923|nr:helix-turn-helix domain-containing protein [Sphingopyxis terrae]
MTTSADWCLAMAEVGRPSDYDPKFADQARKLCELGATDIELADFFEVNVSTIYRWRNQHSEFCEAAKVGKAACDDRVERSLYQRAVGYTFESEKVFQFQGQIVRADTREHVPPDASAALNWLKNRRSDDWRDKREVEHSGGIETTTKEQRDAAVAAATRADT